MPFRAADEGKMAAAMAVIIIITSEWKVSVSIQGLSLVL